jgi:hypothetical protein
MAEFVSGLCPSWRQQRSAAGNASWGAPGRRGLPDRAQVGQGIPVGHGEPDLALALDILDGQIQTIRAVIKFHKAKSPPRSPR